MCIYSSLIIIHLGADIIYMSTELMLFQLTELLSQASSDFKTTSKKLETKLWWKNVKVSYVATSDIKTERKVAIVLPNNTVMHVACRLAALLKPGW